MHTDLANEGMPFFLLLSAVSLPCTSLANYDNDKTWERVYLMVLFGKLRQATPSVRFDDFPPSLAGFRRICHMNPEHTIEDLVHSDAECTIIGDTANTGVFVDRWPTKEI